MSRYGMNVEETNPAAVNVIAKGLAGAESPLLAPAVLDWSPQVQDQLQALGPALLLGQSVPPRVAWQPAPKRQALPVLPLAPRLFQ